MTKKRKQTRKRISISTDIRVALITSITSILVAYFAYNFWEQKKLKDQFLFEKYNSDFAKGNKYFENVNRAYDSLMNHLSINSGLTASELTPFISRIKSQVNEFKYYTRSAEMYGNESQILITNQIHDYLIRGWSKLQIHKNNVELVERQIRTLNAIKVKDSIIINDMYLNFDDLIYNENRIYFELRENYIPILEHLQQIFIGTFREELGLEITSNLVKASINLDSLINKRESFKFNRNQPQYRLAKIRSFTSHKINIPKDSIINDINEIDRREIFSKYLVESLKKR